MTSKNASVIATESFSIDVNGVPFPVNEGITLLREDDPIVRAHPNSFRLVEESLQRGVEQATAAPGEKRKAVK